MSLESEMPPLLDVEIAGAAIGLSRQQSYIAAGLGALPIVRLGHRRMGVQTARLGDVIGRPITNADIERAREIVRARKGGKAGSASAPTVVGGR